MPILAPFHGLTVSGENIALRELLRLSCKIYDTYEAIVSILSLSLPNKTSG
jgi:hypothetical protein